MDTAYSCYNTFSVEWAYLSVILRRSWAISQLLSSGSRNHTTHRVRMTLLKLSTEYQTMLLSQSQQMIINKPLKMSGPPPLSFQTAMHMRSRISYQRECEAILKRNPGSVPPTRAGNLESEVGPHILKLQRAARLCSTISPSREVVQHITGTCTFFFLSLYLSLRLWGLHVGCFKPHTHTLISIESLPTWGFAKDEHLHFLIYNSEYLIHLNCHLILRNLYVLV